MFTIFSSYTITKRFSYTTNNFKMGKKWNNGLFACADNILMCVWVWCVPCGAVCMNVAEAKLINDKDKATSAMIIHGLLTCCCGVYGLCYTRYSIA